MLGRAIVASRLLTLSSFLLALVRTSFLWLGVNINALDTYQAQKSDRTISQTQLMRARRGHIHIEVLQYNDELADVIKGGSFT